MTRNWKERVGALGVGLVWLAIGGCSHHETPASQPTQPPPVAEAAPAPAPPPPPPPPAAEPPAPPALTAQTVYFDLDQSLLSDSSQQTLQQLFSALKDHPDAKLRIEGNCDERGTEEYNIALGQARADAAKKYLVELGATGGKIATVSFGKDHPAAEGHDESAWSQNRRDDIKPQ